MKVFTTRKRSCQYRMRMRVCTERPKRPKHSMLVPSFTLPSHLPPSITFADVYLILTTSKQLSLGRGPFSLCPTIVQLFLTLRDSKTPPGKPPRPHLPSPPSAHSSAVTLLTVPCNYQNIRPTFLKLSQVSQ